jgi:phosphoglycolate phosphatase-like HAD superfamily hydrolase
MGFMGQIIIFDFDGVIADSLSPMLSYAGQVCQELGYPCNPTPGDLEILEQMEFSEFGRQLGVPEALIDKFVNRNFELFSEREEPLAIKSGIKSVIEKLSNRAFLGLVTGNSCKVVEKFQDAHGLNNAFQIILAAEDNGSRVAKILKVISLSGGPKIEAYMIGDAVSDIRAARQAGIISVVVGWGHQTTKKLSEEKPDFLVDRPEDLLTLFS